MFGNLNITHVVLEDIQKHFGAPHGDCERHKERLEHFNIKHTLMLPLVWQKHLGDYYKHALKTEKPSVKFICKEYPYFEPLIAQSRKGFNTNKADALFLALLAQKQL